ncbi:MAG: hypothetical protein JXR56_08225, partial [Candidatus Cloacimonetes bacterium]|nr:hypothetical protein [Candidatus Cloacimonadota bacterium]
TTNSATIGIENASGSEGLKVVYNQTYVYNGLAVVIKNINFNSDDVDWMDASPATGTVNPGAYTDVVLTFDSTGLAVNNNYTANIIIGSNDTTTPSITVPVNLTVVGGFDAPEGATAAVVDGRLQIRWLPVSGATSYNIYMASSPDASYINRNSYGTFGVSGEFVIWTTSFLLDAVSYDDLYFYVKAVAD